MTMTHEPVALEAPKVRRITVDEYYRMAECGILGPEERTELIEGVIYHMAPPGPAHSSDVDGLTERFVLQFHGRARVRVQNPLRLGDHSVPEPDLALLRLREGGYRDRLPTADDILLAVEVADSSLRHDLGRKARLYARFGIQELWVVDLRSQRIVVHRSPDREGYTEVFDLKAGDHLAPVAFEDDAMAVDELLGGGNSDD